jgi:hypothetical protein
MIKSSSSSQIIAIVLVVGTIALAFVAQGPYRACMERMELEFPLGDRRTKSDYCSSITARTFPPTRTSPWSDWAAIGAWLCGIGGACLQYVIAAEHTKERVREERAAFAARAGLDVSNPLTDRAYVELSRIGRAQVQSHADLLRLLRERERYDLKKYREAVRKDNERAMKRLFFDASNMH